MREIYHQDFCEWLAKTAEILRQRRFDELDLDNLIEEIESIIAEHKRELDNRLRILLTHLLKYQYHPSESMDSWKRIIITQRREIEIILSHNPSLKPFYTEIFTRVYSKAILFITIEERIPEHFPTESPFSPDDVISEDFIYTLLRNS
jgi:hypothetical protein